MPISPILVFVPRGDPALTRRASRSASLEAGVVRLSRERKRYERRGILADDVALARAEGECLADADARGRFRLRGFELTRGFEHVAFAGTTLCAYDLRVRVAPDARVTSALVETAGPRMCRNWTDARRLGSWEECRGG